MDNLKKYEWTCPRLGCKYVALMYGESSLSIMRDLHLHKHELQDRESMAEFQRAVKEAAPDPRRAALIPAPAKSEPQDYNKSQLTKYDKEFLKTRGIKWED
jgi:hypothetical protein